MSAVLTGTEVRFATFNVRTSRADFGTSRHWPLRAVSVAYEIKKEPGIVAIQELGPGRADGKRARIGNSIRQTESLVAALRSVGASQYKLTRTTAYIKPGTSHGTQGTRILYDTTKYRLISNCHETTGKRNYNSSCSINCRSWAAIRTPVAAARPTPSSRTARRARTSLSSRRTSMTGTAAASAGARPRQPPRGPGPRHLQHGEQHRGGNPILFGGDLNSWRTKAGSNAPFKAGEHGLPRRHRGREPRSTRSTRR